VTTSRFHFLFWALALALAPFWQVPPACAAAESSAFTIARLKYGGGGDWYGNQSSLTNLLRTAHRRLSIPVASYEEAVVAPLDEALFRHPFLFMSGHGNVKFSPAEVDRLRAYLTAGGFLWCDDDFGIDASFRREMKKVLPESDFIELPFGHELFHTVYEFDQGLPKIHEHDGGPARAYGLFNDGRLVVLYTFDTDLGDGLEDEGTHPDPPEKREQAMRMALNIIVYSLTH
jgi:hypothetical protein